MFTFIAVALWPESHYWALMHCALAEIAAAFVPCALNKPRLLHLVLVQGGDDGTLNCMAAMATQSDNPSGPKRQERRLPLKWQEKQQVAVLCGDHSIKGQSTCS